MKYINLSAQDSTFITPEFDLLPSPCFLPKIESQSEIKTSTDSKVVYLKFEENIPTFFQITEQFGNEIEITETSSKEIIFEVNSASNEVEIALVNSCGDLILTKLSLSIATMVEKDFIDVSPEMGDILQAFVEQQDVPLLDYLANDVSINFFEKLEFYQKFGLKNEKINFDFSNYKIDPSEIETKEEEIWADLKIWRNEITFRDDDCFCDFISIARKHSHFKAIPGGDPDHWYDNMAQKIITNTDHITVGDKGEYWADLQALGASKWLGIQTQGWKRSKVHSLEKHYESGDTTQTNSGKRGTITTLLLCMDGEDLPASCSCDKSGTFYYRYDSNIYAQATLLSGGGYSSKKKAAAAASDAAMVYCYFGNTHGDANIEDFIPIEGIQIGVTAECEGEINPDFWPSIEGLGNSAIDIYTDDLGNLFSWDYEYKYDSTLIRVDTLQNPPLILDYIYRIDTVRIDSSRNFLASAESSRYKDLLSNILNVFTTPYLLNFNCTGGHNDATMAGYFDFTLQPNIKATFIVMTYAKVIASGRRNWHSIGNVASEYSMSIVVKPGKTSGQEEDCCTPWVAGYLVGAPFITGDSELLQYEVGEDLHSEGFNIGNPNGLKSGLGGYLVRGQKGQMSRPPAHGECSVPLHTLSAYVGENAQEESLEENKIRIETDEEIINNLAIKGSQVSIYDVSGRLLGSFTFSGNPTHSIYDIKTHIKQNLPKAFGLGIYIIKIGNNEEAFYFKTLIN